MDEAHLERCIDEAHWGRCMEQENIFKKESIEEARELNVCSRSNYLTHTFYFLVVFLHVGQSRGDGDQPRQSSLCFKSAGA